jgi:hypothetical protein
MIKSGIELKNRKSASWLISVGGQVQITVGIL